MFPSLDTWQHQVSGTKKKKAPEQDEKKKNWTASTMQLFIVEWSELFIHVGRRYYSHWFIIISSSIDVTSSSSPTLWLVSCPSVQLLGISLDCTLTFTDHILNLCKKAGRSVNALARLSKDLDVKSKLVLFQSFVMSHFNYCPCVWHFGRRADVSKIENVQFRCLKYIYNTFMAT